MSQSFDMSLDSLLETFAQYRKIETRVEEVLTVLWGSSRNWYMENIEFGTHLVLVRYWMQGSGNEEFRFPQSYLFMSDGEIFQAEADLKAAKALVAKQREAEELEAKERAELARLKSKYEENSDAN